EARALDEAVVSAEELRALGRFLVFMQTEPGRFRAKYGEQEKFSGDFESLYYPGQAVLALTMLHEIDPDPAWLAAAAKGAAYLVRARAGQRRLPSDHWPMIAAPRLLASWDKLAAPPVAQSEIRAHLIAVGRTMLMEQRQAAQPELRGSFVPDGRSTPTATRVEGLVALFDLLGRGEDVSLRAALRQAITEAVAFLLRCQVLEGPHQGGFVRALRKIPGAGGGFNRRQAEIRIDYVQHALSALLGYAQLPQGSPGARPGDLPPAGRATAERGALGPLPGGPPRTDPSGSATGR
ncbi:MAG: hypothetical protein HY744_05870, partial [Deltaproteobacteria bacterium]|nr:hypothetical protein [Deltaproteobacteria bacterium]